MFQVVLRAWWCSTPKNIIKHLKWLDVMADLQELFLLLSPWALAALACEFHTSSGDRRNKLFEGSKESVAKSIHWSYRLGGMAFPTKHDENWWTYIGHVVGVKPYLLRTMSTLPTWAYSMLMRFACMKITRTNRHYSIIESKLHQQMSTCGILPDLQFSLSELYFSWVVQFQWEAPAKRFQCM